MCDATLTLTTAAACPEGSRIGDNETGAGQPWRPRVATTIETRKPIAPSAADDDVGISHPDRLSYPDPGISKIQGARYFERINHEQQRMDAPTTT